MQVSLFFGGADSRAGEEFLVQLVNALGERLVAQAEAAQDAVHFAVLLEFADSLGDELKGQLRNQGNLFLLIQPDFLLHVEFLLEEGAENLLLHLQIASLLQVFIVELALDVWVGRAVLELARAS